jgi:Holliday junction DNA helicase RuvA
VISLGALSVTVFVPTRVTEQIGVIGDPVTLYTHLHVREDALTLYGFAQADERDLFELLLTVTGVGPRVALALLSALPAESLRAAIAGGDSDTLMRVPGVGKKIAGRIILDLRGKIAAPATAPTVELRGVEREVMMALTNLGYSIADAQEAVRAVPDDPSLPLEERVRLALRALASRST